MSTDAIGEDALSSLKAKLAGLSVTQDYVYEPLPDAYECIRLLEIEAGAPSDLLRCKLSCEKLSSGPAFEALSYVWGDTTAQFPIECEGSNFGIGENLLDALVHLRDPTRSRLVWADAICINQADIVERGQQVSIMHEIYSAATSVQVWLGPDREGVAKDTFSFIQRAVDITEPWVRCMTDSSAEWVDEDEFTQQLQECFHTDTTPHKKLELVKDFLTSTKWFERVWVQQEVGLAKTALMHWGSSTVQWSDIVAFAALARHEILRELLPVLNQYESVFGDMFSRYQTFWSTIFPEDPKSRNAGLSRAPWAKLRPGLLSNPTTERTTCGDVLKILDMGRRLQATQGHDHVFAYLGHATISTFKSLQSSAPGAPGEPGDVEIRADYRLSMEAVNTTIARELTRQVQKPTVLSYVQHDPDFNYQSPSWVPQWHRSPGPSLVAFPDVLFEGRGLFYASNRSTFRPTSATGPSRDMRLAGDTLSIRGGVVDHIADVLPLPARQYFDDDGDQTSEVTVKSLWDSVRHSGGTTPYSNPADRWFALLCTLVGGQSHDGQYMGARAQPRFMESFLADALSFLKKKAHFSEAELDKELFTGEHKPRGSSLKQADHRRFALTVSRHSSRRLFVTTKGYMGLGPRGMKTGDAVCVLNDAPTPFVIREVEAEKHRLIEQCYVHGMMNREATEMIDLSPSSKLWIDLV